MLEKISIYDPSRGIDIEAYTDGYSHDEYGNLYLMSILGPDSAVKGISSGIVSLKEIMIHDHDDWESFSAIRGEKYKIISARLDSGLLHQIVLLDSIFTTKDGSRRLIYIGCSGNIRDRIFAEIKNSFGTPLLHQWKNWLLRKIRNEDLVEIMEGKVTLARLTLNEKQLDTIVGNGVAHQNIRL